MSEVPSSNDGGGFLSASNEDLSAVDEMDVLRRLLIAPEQQKLDQAESRIVALESKKADITSEELADLLPQAVIERSSRDGKLAAALAPTVEASISGSVRRNPQPIVDAIFPVIGPAIRRSIAEALSSTMEGINRTMEHQFSLQGLRWRLEAIRTGQSFSEVVLRNTLLFATEQIFVVHNESGLPLVHASRLAEETQDGSLVTSMLSVIQDFVRDSLGGDRTDSLESIEYGELTIILETGPAATIAAVIRGTPPRSIREDMQELIEEFHMNYRSELDSYGGDPSIFEKAEPLVASYLKVQVHESSGIGWKTWIMLGLLTALIIVVGSMVYRARANWNSFVSAVDDTPGIVVTEVSGNGGVRVVRGLRDPMSDEPALMLAGFGYDSSNVQFDFEPYRALAPDIVARRAAQSLDAPASASFQFVDETLYASGSAGHRWIEEARIRAAQLEDVKAYDDAALVDSDVARILDLSEQMLRTPVAFDVNRVVPTATVGLDRVAELAKAGMDVADAAGVPLSVVVRGYSSPEGNAQVNERLEYARAEVAKRELGIRGIPTGGIQVERGGAATPEVRVLLRIGE